MTFRIGIEHKLKRQVNQRKREGERDRGKRGGVGGGDIRQALFLFICQAITFFLELKISIFKSRNLKNQLPIHAYILNEKI